MSWFTRIFEPQSRDEDAQRREFILNILLIGSLVLTLVAFASSTLSRINQGNRYEGVNPYLLLIPAAIFLGLYGLSRIRFRVIAAYIFIGIYYLLGSYVAYHWGFILSQGLILYILIIIMSSVLISTRASFFVTLLVSVTLYALAYLQTHNIITPTTWELNRGDISDAVVTIFTLGVITIVSWLSNREIEKSLNRARLSEQALTKQRDLLEVTVEERTRELRQAQMEKLLEMSRFAEWGRLAAGILHDLVTPLTTVSLNLERLGSKEDSIILNRAREATRSMSQFIEAARKQIRNEKKVEIFSLIDETHHVIQILEHKAQEQGVTIKITHDRYVEMYGYSIKFYQLMTNLISNAIEAYEDIPRESKKKRQIIIRLTQNDTHAQITVQDEAGGIPEANLGKIFDTFFTTKGEKRGTGIGLAVCKEIIESDFGGTVSVISKEGVGTTFSVELPLRKPPAPQQ